MNRRLNLWLARVGAALVLALTSVPLLATPSHAVEPIGGCWIWFYAPPTYDISSSLAPWANPDAAPKGPPDHKITLSPSAPPAGSQGTLTYSFNKGPENAGPSAQVKGIFSFSVNGGEPFTKEIDFGLISTGQSIPATTMDVPFTVENGVNEVVFEGVSFRAESFSVAIECNGQTSGTAKKNPRTDPEPTNVKASVTSSGVAAGPDPTDPTGLCIPLDLPLPIPNPLACPDEDEDGGDGGGDGGGSGGGGGDSGGDGGGDSGGDGGGDSGGSGSSGVSGGTPAKGETTFDCLLLPFEAQFDYTPTATVAGARKAASDPVSLLANFTDLPGIAPVPIDGPMDVTVDMTVGGKATTVKGSANVNVPPKTNVPVPDLTGSVAADGDTLPVTVNAFSFYFPSFDITGNCKAIKGDIGSMKVGSGSLGGGGGGGGAASGTDAAAGPVDPGATPTAGTPDATAGAAGEVQNLSLLDVRLEGPRSVGELFGAAPQRTLVLVVQNVGATTIEAPYVAMAMGRSRDLEPAQMQAAVGPLAPQQTQRIEIPMEMPTAAIGTYQVAGQVGTTTNGTFGTASQSYPWGLFLLNLIAVAIAAWGLRRHLRGPGALPALATTRDGDTDPDGGSGAPVTDEATIDLKVLDRWFSRPRRRIPGIA